ncbi:MAG: NUDIX hydrolase [Labedaea sp.]
MGILAAGAVLWRTADPLEIAVVHRPRYDDWSLPKGKLEPGENVWRAAAREVAEETGFSAVLGRHVGRVRYRVSRPVAADKTVDYLAARAHAGAFRPNSEVDLLRWVTPAEAANLLSYPHDAEIVRAFLALPPDLATAMLVRHAKAGSRSRWHRPDEARPLSERGWQEVKALRTLLPLFGVSQVHAAPLVRCVQTVQPIAEDLGVETVQEPLLSEETYTGQEQQAVARFREVVGGGGIPALCSQGGVIPDLVARLAAEAELPMSDPESRKASAWVLSFHRGAIPRLAAADYIPKP